MFASKLKLSNRASTARDAHKAKTICGRRVLTLSYCGPTKSYFSTHFHFRFFVLGKLPFPKTVVAQTETTGIRPETVRPSVRLRCPVAYRVIFKRGEHFSVGINDEIWEIHIFQCEYPTVLLAVRRFRTTRGTWKPKW